MASKKKAAPRKKAAKIRAAKKKAAPRKKAAKIRAAPKRKAAPKKEAAPKRKAAPKEPASSGLPAAVVERAATALRASPFSAHTDRLLAALTPAVRLEARPAKELPTGATRLGGRPDVPAGFVWPTWRGRPLSFLAQVDLAEAAAPGLPGEGWLLFFYDLQEQPWGFDPNDRGGAAVAHVTGTLARRATPPGATESPACAVRLSPAANLPGCEDDAFQALGVPLEGDAHAAWFDLVEALHGDGPLHHLLGEPQIVQGCMRLECQLVTNGLSCGDPSGYEDPRAKALAAGARDWRLLLQLDTDEDGPSWMWGDMGRLYLWIREEDLAARRFDAAWLVLQCG